MSFTPGQALEPLWPSEDIERQMMTDAQRAEPSDISCHVRALLQRVRDLERALHACGRFGVGPAPPPPGDRDYYVEWMECIEYLESVDRLLDDANIQGSKDGKRLSITERVQLLVESARVAREGWI